MPLSSYDTEAIGLTLFGIVAVLAFAALVITAIVVSGTNPNHTAVACIEAGMELIDGNCLSS